MNAVDKWHEVMKSGGSGAEDKLDELLHEDVIFYSPVVFTPQKGKDITKLYPDELLFSLPMSENNG